MFQHFSQWDIVVFIAYGVMLVVSGYWFNRKTQSGRDFFLANRSMPMWMVAVSVLATSQSAATFLGGPDQGYRGNLTYLAATISAILGALFVAYILIPRFYQANVFTVYGLLENRFGQQTKQRAGTVYLLGRLLASGSRLYMAAIAVAMILFGEFSANTVLLSIAVIAGCGLLYTVVGGIRSVIYSDVIQCFVYVSAAIAVITWLLLTIPVNTDVIFDALQNPPNDASSKLLLLDWRFDLSSQGVFTMGSLLTGMVLLNIAAYGLDQDMTQRVLTCKSAQHGTRAMLASSVISIPIILLFLVIGLLLHIYYQRPDLMASTGLGDVVPTFEGQTVTIFMHYVLNDMPSGLKAWVTIGIIAAALSTLNSGLNSMASVVVEDMLLPKLKARPSASQTVRIGQWVMLLTAIALSLVAALCFYWQQHTDMPLLQFALSVMVFSYSGLLGVYFTVLFSQRGSATSVITALVVGFMVPVSLQPYTQPLWLPSNWQMDLGFTWQLIIGMLVSTAICMLGSAQSSDKTQSS